MARDDYTCAICDARCVELHVDHIIPFSAIMAKLKHEKGIERLFENAMDYELLWDETNCRTLCIECHKKTDSYLKRSAAKVIIQ